VDVLLGSPFENTKRLYAPMLTHSKQSPTEIWTAEFNDFLDRRKKKVLVDHVFVNKLVLKRKKVDCGVAHDILRKSKETEDGQAISDHVPVYFEFQ
jgi:hypothetical protein